MNEGSAPVFRRLTDPVDLTPEKPEVGRPYFRVRCSSPLQLAEVGSNSLHWWRRLQPIRTVAEIELEFIVFTQEPFGFQRIADEAETMRRLGMSLRAIGAALGVDEKTVRKALARQAT